MSVATTSGTLQSTGQSVFSDSTLHTKLIEDAEVFEREELDPRKRLGKYYSLDGLLPTAVVRKLNHSPISPTNRLSRSDENNDERMLHRVFSDRKLTPKQKEAIAASILRGDTLNIEKRFLDANRTEKSFDNARRSDTMDSSAQKLIQNRHQLKKPQFLQVVSEKSNIKPIQNKYETKYQWPMVMSYPVQRSSSSVALVKNDNPLANAVKTSMIAESKSKMIQQVKDDAIDSKRLIQEFKQKETDRHSKRIEIKKRISDFRQALKQHLVLQKTAQVGNIMRCVTDEMIYHFLDKYDGFSMSIDAIILLIGNTLGSSTVSPYPEVNISRVQRFLVPAEPDEFYSPADKDPTHHKLNDYAPDEKLPFQGRTYSASKARTAPERVVASGFHLRSPSREEYDLNDSMESETVRNSRKEKLSNNGFTDSLATWDDNSKEQEAIESAMSVMREQLIIEGILPSLRPEKVLSEKQLEDIGLHRRSVEDVAKEISRKKGQAGKRGILSQSSHQWTTPVDGNNGAIAKEKAEAPQRRQSSTFTAAGEQAVAFFDEGKQLTDDAIFLNTAIDEGGYQDAGGNQDLTVPERYERWDFEQVNALHKTQGAMPLYGTSIKSPVERESFLERQQLTQQIRELQFQQAEASLASSRDPGHRTTASQPSLLTDRKTPYSGRVLLNSSSVRSDSSVPLGPILRAPKLLAAPPPAQPSTAVTPAASDESKAKPPKSIKSRGNGSGPTSAPELDLFNKALPEPNHPDGLPTSPYKSFNEKSMIFNNGIAAGAGLSLWRPRHKVTKDGRYKVGIASKLRDAGYQDMQQPFFHG